MIREVDELVDAWQLQKNSIQNNSTKAKHTSFHQMMAYNNNSPGRVSPMIANAVGSFMNSTNAATNLINSNPKSFQQSNVPHTRSLLRLNSDYLEDSNQDQSNVSTKLKQINGQAAHPLRNSLTQINEENGGDPAGGLKLPELPGLKINQASNSDVDSIQSKLNPGLQLISRNQRLDGNTNNSYITKLFNTQDMNIVQQPWSSKNAYAFQGTANASKLLPLPRLMLNNTQSTATGFQSSNSNNIFEGSDARFTNPVLGRSINNLRNSIADGTDKSPVYNNQSSQIKQQLPGAQFGSVSIFNNQNGSSLINSATAQSYQNSAAALKTKLQISNVKQQELIAEQMRQQAQTVDNQLPPESQIIEDSNTLAAVRRGSLPVQQNVRAAALISKGRADSSSSWTINQNGIKVQTNKSIGQFQPILEENKKSPSTLQLTKGNGVSNDSHRLYTNSLFEETPNNQHQAQPNIGSPTGSIKQVPLINTVSASIINDQQQQSAGNILSIYQSPKLTKRGGTITSMVNTQVGESVIPQQNSNQNHKNGAADNKEETKPSNPLRLGSPQFVQSSTNTPYKEIVSKAYNIEMSRYQTMVILSQIANKRTLNINVPEQIILTMKNKNVIGEYMAYQEQKISKFRLDIKNDTESILNSWLKLNLAKSQSGTYVPISISQIQIPTISQTGSEQEDLQSQFDFFVITAKNRIQEGLRKLKYYKIKNSGFIISRYVPQRGTEAQVFRAQWNFDRGLKCFLFTSTQQYNGKEEGSLNFERLANLYRDVSLMNESEIKQKIELKRQRDAALSLTPRSQKHTLLQNELCSRFPDLNKQFHLDMPKSSGSGPEKLTRSPGRVIQKDKYSRLKLKMDTKRTDTGNGVRANYRKVIMSIQRQMNELIQCMKQDSQLRETLFGSSQANLKKLTVDFIEDYNSTLEDPAMILLRISYIEAVSEPQQLSEQPLQSFIQPVQTFKCNGDYCFIHQSPFIPTHLAPIIADILKSKDEHFHVSMETIQEDRKLLTQILTTEDIQSSSPFANQMIGLRGAQLITKSQEFKGAQALPNASAEHAATINPFTRNNLQSGKSIPQSPPLQQPSQPKIQEVDVCRLCFRIYSYLDSLKQQPELVPTAVNHSDVDKIHSYNTQQQLIQIKDQEINTSQKKRESVSMSESPFHINQPLKNLTISEEDGRQRAQIVVRYATQEDEMQREEDLEVLHNSAMDLKQPVQRALQIRSDDPNSMINDTKNTAADQIIQTEGIKAPEQLQNNKKKDEGALKSLAIDTFQLVEIIPQEKSYEESPKAMRISLPNKAITNNLVQSLQVQESIEIDNKNLNQLHSIGDNCKLGLSSSVEKKRDVFEELMADQLSFISAEIPRSPPRPMFFYKSATDEGNDSFEQQREKLDDTQNKKSGGGSPNNQTKELNRQSQQIGANKNQINVGASINTQLQYSIDNSLIGPNEAAVLTHANMIKSTNLKNDELLTGGLVKGKFEDEKKSQSNQSTGDLVFIEAGQKGHSKEVDSFFGQVSNQDEEYLVDYVDAGNNNSSSQDEKGDQDVRSSSLSPKITAIPYNNNNKIQNKNSPYKEQKQPLSNSFGLGGSISKNKYEVVKMSANSIVPSSLLVLEDEYDNSVSASGDNRTSQTFTLFNKKIKESNKQSSKKASIPNLSSSGFLQMTNQLGNNNKRTDNDEVQTPIIGKSIS